MKGKIRIFLFAVLNLAFAITASPQREAENWIFGYGIHMNFSTGSPVLQPQIPGGFAALNGTTTISDRNGNLLFYSNGTFIYDRQNQVMPGCGTVGLYGYAYPGPTQSILAVPFPGNDSLYLVFYIEFHIGSGYIPRLRYAVINMNARNGLGDVVQKDMLLLSGQSVCLKLTATLHCNKKDVWVIGHLKDSDKYFSLLVNQNGINATPVLSTGITLIDGAGFSYNHHGYMKASAKGDMVAAGFKGNLDLIELSDFNNQTGQLTNTKTLRVRPTWATPEINTNGPGGVEFSASGKFLYASCVYTVNLPPGIDQGVAHLFQFDLSSNNQTTIQNSRILIDSLENDFYTGMQMAIDGKIYLAPTERYLHCINSPEENGIARNFVRRHVYTGANNLNNLPTFLQSYFQYPVITTGNCQFQNISFSIQNIIGINAVQWNFGDPGSGLNNTSSSLNPTHIFSTSGSFEVTAVLFPSNGCNPDTIRKMVHAGPFQVFLGSDTTICSGDTLTLTMNIPGATNLWSTGSTNDTIRITQSGTYWVRTNLGQCIASDTIVVTTRQLPVFTLGSDTILCPSNSLVIYPQPSQSNVTYNWNTGSSSPTIVATSGGYYWLEVTDNTYGCSYSDTLNVQDALLPNFNIGNDTTLCVGKTLTIDASLANANSYNWNTGSNQSSIIVSQTGEYWAEVEKDGCLYRDSISVIFNPTPIIFLGGDTVLCEGEILVLDAQNPGSSYIWQNGSNSQSILVNQQGEYNVTVLSNGCHSSDTIQVDYKFKPQFSLGQDISICPPEEMVLDPHIDGSYSWQDGSSSPVYRVRDVGLYFVTITNGCGSKTDSLLVDPGICELFIPSGFTPNNDGKNDIFKGIGKPQVDKFEMRIYNRWGEIVFKTNSLAQGWDGKFNGVDSPAGVYVWVVKYNSVSESKSKLLKGTFTLIR